MEVRRAVAPRAARVVVGAGMPGMEDFPLKRASPHAHAHAHEHLTVRYGMFFVGVVTKAITTCPLVVASLSTRGGESPTSHLLKMNITRDELPGTVSFVRLNPGTGWRFQG